MAGAPALVTGRKEDVAQHSDSPGPACGPRPSCSALGPSPLPSWGGRGSSLGVLRPFVLCISYHEKVRAPR